MKRWSFVLSAIILLAALTVAPPWTYGENYGRLRAMKHRADVVIRQKNNFVARVLHSYNIPHKLTDQGVVAQLQIGTEWQDVNRIDIVPLFREGESGLQVTGHEIFFYTEDKILHFVSALTIR